MGVLFLPGILLSLVISLLTAATRPSVPLHFEENHGQAAADARFIGRASGLRMEFDPSGASLLPSGTDSPVRISFVGGRALPSGYDPTGGESHYLLGTDPAKWRRHIKHFRRVRYANLYPGIDLVFYGNGANLEFDFAVHPGADPGQIRLRFDGAGRLAVLRSGDLVIGSGKSTMRLAKPVIYQPLAAGNRAIEGSFRLGSDRTMAFQLGDYDRGAPLIIDPVVLTTTYWGGVSSDVISGVASDSSGNIYLTGHTTSTTLTTTVGAYKRALNPGDSDCFVTKLNSTASTVLYSTFVGGTSPDYARAIAVDSSGAAYITGSTIGFFPITSGAYRQSPTEAPETFAAKLDATGASLSYATYLGGAGAGQGIAVDSSGNAWIAGFTYTPSFPVTLALQPVFSGGSDAFLLRLNPTGTGVSFSTFLGGRGEDQATAVAVDAAGDAYVTGFTSGQGFLVTGGAYQSTLSGSSDAFAAKVSPGGSVTYSTYLGGILADRANAIAIDSAGNAYLAGHTSSTNFPVTSGAFQTSHGGGTWDGFITKLNAAGSALTYSTFLGGSGTCLVQDLIRSHLCDSVLGIAVDSSGIAYLAGLAGSGFPLLGAPQSTAGGAGDGFAAQLNATGTKLLYSTFVGGAGGDMLSAVALSSGIAVMGGVTSSVNLPVSSGALRTTNAGGYEGFLTRLGSCTVTLGSSGSFFPNTAGTYSLDVFAASNCSWSASTSNSWVTLNTQAGVGNGQISYTVAANTGLHRTGQINAGGQIFTIEQVTGSCVQLGYYHSWFPATTGSYSLPVFATCGWTAASNQSWITIGTPTGTGNGTVGYTIAANTSGAVRSGQIDVNGIKFDIDQVAGAGSIACSYALSRTQDSFDRFGGSSSLLVTAVSGCEWTVGNPPTWITITAGPAGNGNGIVGYTAAPNQTGQARSAQLTIAGQPVLISQSN